MKSKTFRFLCVALLLTGSSFAQEKQREAQPTVVSPCCQNEKPAENPECPCQNPSCPHKMGNMDCQGGVCPVRSGLSPEKQKWTLGGEARFRFETRDNRDLNSATNDHNSFVGSRVRLNVGFQPSENLQGFIQPQFSEVWGQGTANIAGNGTLTGGIINSGGITDPALNIHQAYANWKMSEQWRIIIGRQELAYGDEIVVGPLGFSNVGRSFDAILVRTEGSNYKTDFFYSKIADEDVAGSAFLGEYDFAGAYNSLNKLSSIDSLDLYGLYVRDRRTGAPTSFNFGTFGLRIKDQVSDFDYRFEGNGQVGQHLGNKMLAYMVDAEAGYTIHVKKDLRLALEYNRASGDKPTSTTFTRYHQLFPTMHRWLGYMDLFGRQNIQSGIFHANLKINKKWNIAADLHSFWRVESQDVIYSIVTESPYAGQPAVPTTGKKHVGEEVDLTLGYNPMEFIAIKIVGGMFFPGAYFKSSVGNDVGYFSYVQTTFTF